MTISENVSLAPFTTFGIGGPARYFCEAATEADILDAVRWAREAKLRLYVIGGGSNLLVPDEGFDGLVLRVAVKGIAQSGGRFSVAAGESWDDFVDFAIEADCAGVECLAGIPGSTGGTPVQNVGAYGQEVSETIKSVRAFDRQTGFYTELSTQECGFRYRESIFNTVARGRYIVTSVTFELAPHGAPALRYADLQKRFAGKPAPTLSDTAQAVRDIRRSKGMVLMPGDPDTQSAGSYFKNPVISGELLPRIAAAASVEEDAVPHWPAGDHRTKLAAAWLLERAGFVKGYGAGRVSISTKHTLALTNRGGATFADLLRLQDDIVQGVEQKFGVRLEREPVLLI